MHYFLQYRVNGCRFVVSAVDVLSVLQQMHGQYSRSVVRPADTWSVTMKDETKPSDLFVVC